MAAKILKAENESQLFFVLNADVICDFPFQELLDYHRSHGKEGTIITKETENSKRMGVITAQADTSLITKFEKSASTDGKITASTGIYLFNSTLVDRIEKEADIFLEREIFPNMTMEAQLM